MPVLIETDAGEQFVDATREEKVLLKQKIGGRDDGLWSFFETDD